MKVRLENTKGPARHTEASIFGENSLLEEPISRSNIFKEYTSTIKSNQINMGLNRRILNSRLAAADTEILKI